MRDLPYFKWFPKDAETDENFRAMSDAEIGFYIRCLNHSWLNGGLPADPAERARALRNTRRYADRQWRRVGRCFEIHPDDPSRVINERQEEERAKAKAKSASASRAVRTRYERRHGRSTDATLRALTGAGSGSVSSSSEPERGGLEGVADFSDVVGRIAEFYPNPSQFQVGIQRLTECRQSGAIPWLAQFERMAKAWSAHWRETSNGRNVAAHGAPKFAEFVENYNLIYSKGPPVAEKKLSPFERVQRVSKGQA